MASKSVISDGQQIQLAMELIELGARLQLLETETTLSRDRLLKLYKEMRGISPPKGMLPFSTDWFMTWQPNIHASLFMSIHRYLIEHAKISSINATLKAYRLYLEQLPPAQGAAPLLSLTRAWTLVRFFDSKMLSLIKCHQCRGQFVGHALDLHYAFRCGLCRPPSRAGKKKNSAPAGIAA
jgi:flagellar transcriptional activator FlhC